MFLIVDEVYREFYYGSEELLSVLQIPGMEEHAVMIDSASKNAPAGSETAVAVMKSAVAAANNAFESVQKAVKQASDVAEANFQAVQNTAVNAAKTTTQTASRKR